MTLLAEDRKSRSSLPSLSVLTEVNLSTLSHPDPSVSNRSGGNPAWAWRRRSMDRPKLAICAIEKAPPSFPPSFFPAFLRDSYWTPTNNKLYRASEPHLTICHCQPVGVLACLPGLPLRNTFQLQPPVQSGDGEEDIDTRARIHQPETFLRGFFSAL